MRRNKSINGLRNFNIIEEVQTLMATIWGQITGLLTDQTDLKGQLDTKVLTTDPRLSDSRTPTTHSHVPGDVTGTAVVTNDARLSDSRTPLTHSHAAGDITGTAVVTNDSRLSDARTPTAHNQAWSTIQTTPTTLSGYSISDAVSANGAITGATKTKVTYDAKGLVTSGADASCDDISDGTTYKRYSATEQSKLSGIASGAVADHVNIANKGTNTHSTIDTFISSKASASGLASLDASSKLVQGLPRTQDGLLYASLANDTLAQAYATNSCTKVSITASRTFTTTVPSAGCKATTIISSNGAWTVTFGTGFKPTATLVTASGKLYVVIWISDGTNLYESGRTIGMTP